MLSPDEHYNVLFVFYSITIIAHIMCSLKSESVVISYLLP